MDLEALLRGVRDGDEAAWDALDQQLRGELRVYFLRDCDEATADELAQRTLVVLTRELPGFDPRKESLRKWVFGIARNLRLSEYAARARSEPLPEPDLAEDQANTSPSSLLYGKEARTILRDEIDKLPPHYRAVMKNASKGGDIKEFAKRQNISVRTAYSRCARAMEILRERLSARLPQPLQLPTMLEDSTSRSPSPPPP